MRRLFATLAWGLASLGFAAIGTPSAQAWDPFSVAVFEPIAEPGLVYFQRGADIIAQDPFEGEPKTIAAGRTPSVSRDGGRLAYVRDSEGRDQLVVGDADGANARPVFTATGTGLGRPAWSPDGRHVAVTDFGASTADVMLVDTEGGAPRAVAEGLEGMGRTLSFSPDGTRLALDQLADNVRFVVALMVESGTRDFLDLGAQPSYGPDGDIAFLRSDRLWILQAGEQTAAAFIPPRANGEPSEFGHRHPAYAPDGSALVFEREDGERSWITWAPLGGGAATRLTAADGVACCPAWAAEPSRLPGISISDATSGEGDPLSFTVSISQAVATDVTVTATTSGGTASSGEDFVARVAEVTIPAGQTQAVFVVDTVEDSGDEVDETLSVLLSSPVGGVIDDGLADAVITDDDAQPQPVSIADATGLEGFDLRFEVGLAAPAATDVTVTATTVIGSAVSPGDFTAHTTQVEIPAGLTNAGFVVTTLDDTLDEPAETFTVTLSGAVGATIEDGSATGTIIDKSRIAIAAPAPVLEGGTLRFPVRLDHPAPADVTVELETQDGTATAPGDYAARSEALVTLAAGQTEAFFDVPTGTDFLDEPDETLTARILSTNGPASPATLTATGTIQDKPPPTVSVAPAPTVTEGGALAFPVRLTGSRPGPVTVELTTQDGTAQAPGDYTATTTTLTIPASQDEAQFVVPTVDDGWDEPDETVTARITRTTNVRPSLLSATATIRDNDEPLPNVRIEPPTAVDEGSALRFPVRLDRAGPGPIDVRVSTADGTATAQSDYTAQSSTLVRIPAGATEAFLEVPTSDDGFDEPDETLAARIVSTINAVPSLLSATGTIRDNDEPLPTVRIDAPTAVDEGSALRFPLRLDRATPGPVDIWLSTVDGTATAPGDYTAQSLTLVRIPAGASEGFLEVPTATDQLTESDETVRAEIKSTINVLPSLLSATGTIRDADGPTQLVPGRLHQGKLLTGKVLVKPPRSTAFIDLGAAAGLPVGTQIDARAGEIELTMAVGSRRARTSAARRARFSRGVFTIRQARASSPVTIALSGSELRRCGRDRKAARRLWADGAGGFVTRGRYASASSGNGRWLTEDRCTFTRISVARGRVAVRDSDREQTRTVRARRALTISPRRGR